MKGRVKMRGKKIMAVLLGAAMVVGLCSCKGQQTVDNDEVPTLVWYIPGEKQADIATVMEAANVIIEEEIGAKLDLRIIDSGSYTEKMNMMMSSQEVFDLCFTGFVNPFNKTAQKGAYLPLDELLKETPALWESIPEWLWDTGKIDGEIYAMPNYQIEVSWTVPFIYNNLIEECNLDLSAVKNAEDLEVIIEKVREKHPEKTFRTRNALAMFWGGKVTEEIVSGVYIEEGDENLTAKTPAEDEERWRKARILNDWFEKGYIRSDAASVTDDELDLVNGKYLLFLGTYYPGVEAELKPRLKSDMTPILFGEPYITRGTCNNAMTAISRTSKYPEKAIKLMELMNTNKELYNIIIYGVEGKHYTKVDENHIKLDTESGYYMNGSWKLGNQFNSYLLEGMPDDAWEQTMELNNKAKKSPLLGFVFDQSPVSSQIAQVNAVMSEYSTTIANGSIDVNEYYDEYMSRIKAAGIDEIREEVQRQIDEYKKTLK